MNLARYHDKPVRIVDVDGADFEGVAQYDSAEYCEIELGHAEEALEIENWVFYRKDILAVELLTGDGENGPFSAPYGRIERCNLEDGEDAVEDELQSDEPVHALRMLRCLEAEGGADLLGSEKVRDALEALVSYGDGEAKALAGRLLARDR